MKIEKVRSRWVLDSQGNPTVEVDVVLCGGIFGRAAAPAGVTVGLTEAAELRDNSRRFGGKGVSKALNIIEHAIAPIIKGFEVDDQEGLDVKLCSLDGTNDKSRYGSNAILAVSLAAARAAAQAQQVPFYRYVARLADHKKLLLPMPMFNIINGGAHADNSTDVQEYMIIPKCAHDIHSAVRIGTEIFHELGKILKAKNFSSALGAEGGYVPWHIKSNTLPLDMMIKAIWRAGYDPGQDIVLGLDISASQLYKNGRYSFACEKKELGAKALTSWYAELIEDYPLASIEDPFFEEAWADWSNLTSQFGSQIQIVGDDLITTNLHRLQTAITKKAANTLLVKPNQIGTLTETIQTVKAAQAAGWRTIMAHRAGETEDNAIAHLAVGLNCGQIKAGCVASGERTAKYNELLRISESLQNDGLYPFWEQK
jgi:enolase